MEERRVWWGKRLEGVREGGREGGRGEYARKR